MRRYRSLSTRAPLTAFNPETIQSADNQIDAIMRLVFIDKALCFVPRTKTDLFVVFKPLVSFVVNVFRFVPDARP